uniref:Uncharacterized protein n=1 Tax=Pyrodinium bahamense TaxID=73915 RepID=A0A7S0FME2_9DINO|mmetsp:Transcript_37050/g.103061  ORF Transcript_37050/g.103061 Transcript_37050/m.103061 type:complete len:746 (+) Transcript_37050:121-2358(+)
MHQSIKAGRKGRNLYNYSTSALHFKGSTRRNSLIGRECIQNRLENESFMKCANYDGRLEVKKCTTLNRAIIAEEQRRRESTPTTRPRPGYLGDAPEPPDASSSPVVPPPMQTTPPPAQHSSRLSEGTGPKVTPPPKEVVKAQCEAERGARTAQRCLGRWRKAVAQASSRINWVDTRQLSQHQEPSSLPGGSSSSEADPLMQRHSTPVKFAKESSTQLMPPSRRTTSPVQEGRASSPQMQSGSSAIMAGARSPRSPSSLHPDLLMDNSRLPQQNSGSGGAQFVIGDRLDPKKWGSTLQRNKKRPGMNGAHYEYIVEQLRRRRQDSEDAEREELDFELLSLVHERGGASPAASPRRARSLISPRPMAAAFTDRALRKREGLGSRAAFGSDDSVSSGGATSHIECNCAACKPFQVKPAGQPSHAVHSNLMLMAHLGTDAALPPPTPRSPTSGIYGLRTPGSPTYDSSHLNRIFKDTLQSLSDSSCCVDELDEHSFRCQMGNKTKQGQGLIRSRSADTRSAGRYRRKIGLDLEASPYQRFHGEGVGESPLVRSEVAMILSPRGYDPPRPTKITSCKRADGEHKYKLSRHAERGFVHWNQPLYRYEVASVQEMAGLSPARCRSPPNLGLGALLAAGERAPISGWWCEGAVSDSFLPLDPGGSTAGHRSPRPQRGGCEVPRPCEAALVTNHELVAEGEVHERAERLATDMRFADLCAVTEATSHVKSKESRDLKEKLTQKAQEMATALSWT